MSKGKYRLRTWLRRNLPYALANRIPKGPRDCGNHEWYRRDDEHEACYHCEVGERRVARDRAAADAVPMVRRAARRDARVSPVR